MINLFAIAPYDQSIFYLAQIFGPMNDVLMPPGVTLASAGFNAGTSTFSYTSVDLTSLGNLGQTGEIGKSLFGEMFRVFNSTILAIAALIVVYVTVVGVMASAHEGEFMGKRFDKLWMPLRMVLGIVFLIPTTSGYSTLQLVMMWVIVQGIGAADTLWSAVLFYVKPPAAMANLGSPSAATEQQMKTLFQAVLCDETARYPGARIGYNYDGTNTYCYDLGNDDPRMTYCAPTTIPFNTERSGSGPATNIKVGAVNNDAPHEPLTYEFGPGGSCGMLSYCNPSTTKGVIDKDAIYKKDEQSGARLKNPDGTDKTLTGATYKEEPGVCANEQSSQCKACREQADILHATIELFRAYAAPIVVQDWKLLRVNYQEEEDGDGDFTPEMKKYCDAQNITGDCNYALLPNPRPLEQSASANAASYLYWPFVLKPMVQKGDSSSSTDFIKAALDNYKSRFEQLKSDEKKPGGQTQQEIEGVLKFSQQLGWIFAGAFYYNIAQINNQSTKAYSEGINISPPPTEDNELNEKQDSEQLAYVYRTSYKTADMLVKASQGHPQSDPPGSDATNAVSDAAGGFGQALLMLTGSSSAYTNPLITLQAVGYWLLILVPVIFSIFVSITVLLGLLSGLNAFVIGIGGINPMFAMTPILYALLVPLLFGILGLMLAIGALLGVYVPLIPYIVFTMGALGWLTACIETMVAGPLVALGILSPGGQHELLGRAGAALIQLLQMFLRPSLMIFGLIAAMFLASVVVQMINTAFGMVLLTIMQQGATGGDSSSANVGVAAAFFNPVEAAFFLVAYVALIISALNKCFAAIHIIPERVFSWIGAQGMIFGEDQALQETKGAVTGAAQKAGSGASQIGQGMGQGGKEVGKNQGDENLRKERDKDKQGPTMGGGGGGGAGGGGA